MWYWIRMVGITFVLVSVLCGASAEFVDICGMDCVNRCWLSDPVCIKDLDYAVRAWSNTSEAEAYSLEPLDPLEIMRLSINLGTERVILYDVQINGLIDTDYQVRVNLHESELTYHENYTHRVVLTASRSSVLFLKTGILVVDSTPVELYFSNLLTSLKHYGTIVTRCTGSSHLNIQYEPIELSGGSMDIISGLKIVFNAVDKDNYTIALIDKVAELSTLAITNNLKMLNSIADFSALYLDNINNI